MIEDHSDEFDCKQRRRFWKEHIDRWQQDSMSQAAYCRQYELKQHQFTYWKKRLSQIDSAITFVPLQLAHRLPTAATKPGFNLYTPNGFRIEVAVGFDPATLKQLISAVQSL